MAYNITGVEEFDHKRTKVTLDYGEVAFLLYKGECRRFGIGGSGGGTAGGRGRAKAELSDEEYAGIRDEILIPRAKKRVLYYMKNADKTRHQIRQKLREGYYPDEVIDAVMAFLDHYGFADDQSYAESYIEELRGICSRREIEAKLMQRGLKSADIRTQLETLTEEDEHAACMRAFQKKYPGGLSGRGEYTPDDRTDQADQAAKEKQKAYAFLARKGFSPAVIRSVLHSDYDD